MKRNDSKPGQTKLLSLGAPVVLAAILVLLVFVAVVAAQTPWPPPDGPFLTGDVCVAAYPINPINCTANDYGIEQFRLVNLIEPCQPVPPGTTDTFTADFEVVLNTAGPDRYNPSFFISLDGTSALTGTNCLHGYLAPPITDAANLVYTVDVSNTLSGPTPDTVFYGPWWDGGKGQVGAGDTCGDMERNTFAVVSVQNMTFPCVDTDGNGQVDVDTCAGYSLPSAGVCTDVTGAYPDTPSKCRCSKFNFPFNITAVELAAFNATPQADGVLLTWETGSELDNIGFNIYRASSPDGSQTQVNERLILAQGAGGAAGASYSFVDQTAAPGQTYYYWLEDLDTDGVTTQTGPVEASVPAGKALPGRPRPEPIPAILGVIAGLVVWAIVRL